MVRRSHIFVFSYIRIYRITFHVLCFVFCDGKTEVSGGGGGEQPTMGREKGARKAKKNIL